ncbi:MAG: hypothetical protein MRZ79_10260 [Bacteroidia bacterium]|nr:hypothetical protein [Bacteroidia bacterium]
MNLSHKYFPQLLCIGAIVISYPEGPDPGIIDQAIDCSNIISTYKVNLDPKDCQVKLSLAHSFSMSVDEDNNLRNIFTNSIPDHLVGEFPNAGNPNAYALTHSSPKT